MDQIVLIIRMNNDNWQFLYILNNNRFFFLFFEKANDYFLIIMSTNIRKNSIFRNIFSLSPYDQFCEIGIIRHFRIG